VNDGLLSKPTFFSIGLLGSSVLFVAGAVASVIVIYTTRKYEISKIVRYPLTILTCLHVLASMYLIFYGFIPVITWS